MCKVLERLGIFCCITSQKSGKRVYDKVSEFTNDKNKWNLAVLLWVGLDLMFAVAVDARGF